MNQSADELEFSVIVPTYNRPEALLRCIQALARLDYPSDRFEIVVVNDEGATSFERVDESACDDALPLRLLISSHGGPAKARNYGASRARGRFFAFTDDDCQPAVDWLTELAQTFEHAPDFMVGGQTINGLPHNIYCKTCQSIDDAVYTHYNADVDQARFFASNNMALPASLFREIGGFDEGFRILACEDRELCDRWLHQGRKMRYAPAARVYHYHSMTLLEFSRQRFTYGRGAVHYHRIRAQRGSGSMRHDLGLHTSLNDWLIQPVRRTPMRQKFQIFGLLIYWQFCNLAGFIYERLVSRGYRRVEPERPDV